MKAKDAKRVKAAFEEHFSNVERGLTET